MRSRRTEPAPRCAAESHTNTSVGLSQRGRRASADLRSRHCRLGREAEVIRVRSGGRARMRYERLSRANTPGPDPSVMPVAGSRAHGSQLPLCMESSSDDRQTVRVDEIVEGQVWRRRKTGELFRVWAYSRRTSYRCRRKGVAVASHSTFATTTSGRSSSQSKHRCAAVASAGALDVTGSQASAQLPAWSWRVLKIRRRERIGMGVNGYWSRVSRVWGFLRRGFEAPWWMRSAGFFLALAAVCAVLGVAGASYSAALICGAVAAFVAEHVVEAWWLRRERQRDAANGYVRES